MRWALLVIGFATSIVAQTAQALTSPDVAKIRRYLDLEMYGEATNALEATIKADEFNGELRLLYGTALRGLRRYDDAIQSLQLATKLMGDRWDILDNLLQCYLEKYAQSGVISDRILAYKTALRLVAFSQPGEVTLDKSFQEAQRRAKETGEHIMAELNSPAGVWRITTTDGSVDFSVAQNKDGSFVLHEKPLGKSQCSQPTCVVTTFREVSPTEFIGSSLNSKLLYCMVQSEFALRIEDSGTKLIVREISSQYKGPAPYPIDASLAQLKINAETCKTLQRGGSLDMPRKWDLERVR